MERRTDTILEMLIKAQTKRHNETNYIFDEDEIITLITKCKNIKIEDINNIIKKI